MLQKPPLERAIGNENSTTLKPAYDLCENIATTAENISKGVEEGVSSDSGGAPEKSQFMCDSELIKKSQDTEITKQLHPDITRKENSENSGVARDKEKDERFVKICEHFCFECFVHLLYII